jgi:hypothetical protein
VQIRDPEWHLVVPCPVCEQGSSLLLVVCPGCAHIAVVCAEERSAFVSPAKVSASGASDPERTLCPSCSKHVLAKFRSASSQEIQSAGLRQGDYE